MKWTVPVVFGVAGVLLGIWITEIAQRIVAYKCKRKGRALPPDGWYQSVSLKGVLGILTMFVWASAAFRMENSLTALLVSILFSGCVVVTIIDLRVRLIPNELILFLFLAGAVYQVSLTGRLVTLPMSLLCMVGMVVIFSIVAKIMGFDKVGAGDVKLAGAMGWVLGYPDILTALGVMCVVFLVFTVLGLLLRKLTLHTMVPMAPFLMMGMAAALLSGVFGPELALVQAFFS